LLAGDQLVLCTDGIHRCVTADEIEETLQSSESSAEAVARLLLMTKMRGNLDNGTLIVGRDLLVPTPLATESPVRFEQTFRSVAALVMLLCTALFLAVLIYRAGTIEPNSGAPDTYAADKH
jgi:hypothetical protein